MTPLAPLIAALDERRPPPLAWVMEWSQCKRCAGTGMMDGYLATSTKLAFTYVLCVDCHGSGERDPVRAAWYAEMDDSQLQALARALMPRDAYRALKRDLTAYSWASFGRWLDRLIRERWTPPTLPELLAALEAP